MGQQGQSVDQCYMDFFGTKDSKMMRMRLLHGTHVAGIIGAEANNKIGIAGVNPGARIYPMIYGHSVAAELSVLNFIIENPAIKVVNGSYGTSDPYTRKGCPDARDCTPPPNGVCPKRKCNFCGCRCECAKADPS